MASREMNPRRLGLRPRFMIATALLVVTAVTASLWTLGALSRLSTAAGETLRLNDEATRATAQFSSALEREDDALLLVLTGDTAARASLATARRMVDERFANLDAVLNEPTEQELVDALRRQIDTYRRASDVIAQETPGSLVRYHREVNPSLRLAVGIAARLRDRHFESTQRMATNAHDEVSRARGVVLGISLTALVVSVLLALHLARLVIVPLSEMTRRARAIARESFEERLVVKSRDELGDLAAAFNEMAEHLSEFRRINLGEVLRAKAALESTLQALPDAVVLLDGERHVLSMNRRAREVLDIRPTERVEATEAAALSVGGVALSSLVDPSARSSVETMDLASALRVDVGGASRRLLARSLRVPDLDETRTGVILVLYDVTELARLDEMRGELIAVASHELRTPLTTLRMSLLMLTEGGATLPIRERELVATCLAGVGQLGDTIDEFLDLTRIEAGRLRLNVEPIDLESFLDGIRERWRDQALGHGVELSVDASSALVEGDSARLRVVLDNLLSNAIKYTPSGGHVWLSGGLTDTNGSGRHARITVTDSGPGIPDEYRARVFEKFFRVEHHVSEADEGTRGVGIGLYLCQQIVVLHGGRIWCEAGDDGRGTRVGLDLPLSRDAAA